MINGISVIICCYNSSSRIKETLKHIGLQVVSKEIIWEVIIVNNCSSDNTEEVAKKEWSNNNISNVPFKIVKEDSPGLSYARNKGINEAKFEFIILCDDDNWLDKNYIKNAFTILKNKTIIGAVGGQSIASSDGPFPSWFEKYKDNYAIGKQGNISGDVSDRGYLWGAGIVFRKSLYEIAFSKCPPLLTDRIGGSLSSGGDSEICKRILLLNKELHYCDELKFTHFIPQYRLTENYRDNLLKSLTSSKNILDKYSELIFIRKIHISQKIYFFCSAIFKLIILSNFNKKGKDIQRDKRWIYFISGLNLNVDKISIQIKNISKTL
ncbi:glycosyltransferase [Pleomorphovibrio marinus]|uniref:glycosyltransferase n=1 Tax=Pleomorphovibrio marinus TaxID=2164132 RepID=UPI000E0BFBD5|nr:glycosyltransferase [Pleomorphovibrio marinus]